MKSQRWLSSLVTGALLAAGLTFAPTSPAAAAGELTLDKTAPAESLLGEDVEYKLTAQNTTGAAQYNLSFSDILPDELQYKPGSAKPAVGEPTITTSGGRQVLTWRNVTDLQANADFTLTFEAEYVTPIAKILDPNLDNDANAATSNDPRTVPTFNSNGTVATASFQASDSATTKKIGVEIEKTDNNSPEDELLRGVHDQRTVYTLTIRNNKVVPTEKVLVSDFIPAGMEFLGCGVDDFTTPDTKVEYTGADRLGVPPMTVDDCLTPDLVDTLVNPIGIVPVDTYTSIEWSLGTLTPSQVVTIKYAAGIPLKANTDTWSGTRPEAASLEQGSNLDNNNGPSTRELDPEATLTNHAEVTGVFKGEDPVSGDPVDIGTFDTTTHTVTIEDLRILKSVTPKTFTPGGVAEFTFTIDTSEYMTADGITITDFLPDGYCPLGTINYSNANPECAPQAGVGPTINGNPVDPADLDVQWVSPNYEITFSNVPAMTNNDTVEVKMPAAMLTEYRESQQPTVAGDAFRNRVELEGTTTPISGVSTDGIETGPQAVTDSSSAGQTTPLPTIDKTMQPRYIGVDCQDLVTHPYKDYKDMTATERTFRKGDTICFKLRVDFPDISTKNPVVTDFVPVGTEYIGSSYWLTPANTVNVADFDDSDPLKWTLGTDDNGDYFVAPNQVFEAVIAVTVLSVPIANAPEITGNLMKMRTENTAVEAESYRDMADYEQAPAPNLGITKGVRETSAPANTFNPPGDDKPVQEGSVATFQIDLRNGPRPLFRGTEFSTRGVQVWDVLPVEEPTINCSSVSNYRYIKPGTSTVEDLDPSLVTCETTFVNINGTTKSLPTIKWTMPNPDGANDYSISTLQTLSLLYDVAVPAEVSVSTKWNNTAYVRQFSAYTNILDVTANYYPEKNIDPEIKKDVWDARELKDPSSIRTPNATVSKTGETEIVEDNNNKLTEATIGELVYYEYSVTIPAGSTVYNGRLYDVLPAGFTLVSADEWGLKNGTQPADFTFNADGSLDFPDTYDNKTASAQEIYVKVTAQVTKAAVTCASEVNDGDPCEVPPAPDTKVSKTNTAKFDSNSSEGGSKLPTRERSYKIDVVQPDPAISKSANPDSVKNSKEDITYTLTATNPLGRPPLHNVVIVDCIPDQVQVKTVGQDGVLGTNPNCQTTDQVSVTWTLDPPTGPKQPLGPGDKVELTYVANIKAGSPANIQFRNTVALGGSSMPGTVPEERHYVTGANADVLIDDGAITKDVQPTRATIGQTVTSTIDVKLTDAEYSNLVITDAMPVNISTAAGSFTTVSVECFVTDVDYAITGDCSTPNPSYLPLAPVGQDLGWSFGPLPDKGSLRIIRVTYTARVTNDQTNNNAGDTKLNLASAYYGYASQPTTMAETDNPPNTIGTANDSFQIIEPDVTIAKSVNDAKSVTVLPGEIFNYKVTVTNLDRLVNNGNHGATAYDITVEDLVPIGVVPSEISDGGIFDSITRKITWPVIESLGIDGTVTFTYKGKLAGDTASTQENTATVTEYFSLPTAVPNPDIREYGPVQATADVTPVLPDVLIEKFATDALAYVGQPYTWQILVTNPTGKVSPGATAYEVGVNDTLPPNWEYVAGSSSITLDGADKSKEPSVSGDPQILTWSNIGDLPADGQIFIEFQATPTAPGVLTDPGVGLGIDHENEAEPTWKNGPPTDNWGTVTGDPSKAVTEIAEGDLEIVKTHVTDYDPSIGADEVVPGTSFIWQMDVTNNGPDPFHGPYTIVDTLPTGVTYDAVIGNDWSCQAAGQVVTCTTPDVQDGLPVGDSLPTLQLQVSVDPAVTGDLENSATVSGKTYEENTSNNTDTDKVTARPQTDVAMVKTSSKPYIVGQQVTYTLAVTNAGPSTVAAPLTVIDTLPSGLSITSIDAGPWQCSPTSGETVELTCVLNEALGPNDQAPLINVTVEVLETPGPTAENCAVAEAATEDTNPANNVGCVIDPVVSEVELGVEKRTTGANPVTAGESTEFTITVTNKGPAKAKNVQVVDTLESGLLATSASGKGWTCDVGSGSVVTCKRANFPVKDSPSDIVITAKVASSVPAGTTLKNTATVSTTSPQPGGEVPPAISTVEVVAKADLSIVKSHKRQPWTIGKQGRWFMTVTNNGPSDNPGPITVTDQLPRGTEFVSAAGTGWTCDGAGRAFTCVWSQALVTGQSTTEFSVLVNVVQGAHPAVINTATVTSPIPDTNPDNNTATDRVPVERAEQNAEKLPPSPELIKSGRTEQGQKIRTRVRCRPLKASAAGEVSFCKIRRTKGAVKVEVVGSTPMRVTVTQFARGTKNYKPWKRVKSYVVRPGKR